MANFTGYIGHITDDSFKKGIYERMRLYSWLCHEDIQEDGFYLHRVSAGKDNSFQRATRDGVSVFIHGELYPENNPKENPAEYVLNAYIKEGESSLSGFNGNYIVVVWESKKNTLLIANDRFGFCHLFYWYNAKGFMFGTKIAPFLSCHHFSKELDFHAISDYFQLGYILADKTLFKNVKRLPAGSLLRYANSQVEIHHNAHFVFSNERWNRSLTQLADEMYEVLERVYERRIHSSDKVLIPLSGGIDSRINIAFYHKFKKENIDALTYGLPYHTDWYVAKKITQQLCIPHILRPFKRDYMQRYFRQFLNIMECNDELIGAQAFPIVEHAQDRYYHIVTGTLGNTFRYGNLMDEDFSFVDEEQCFGRYIKRQIGVDEILLQSLFVFRDADRIIKSTMETSRHCFESCKTVYSPVQKLIYLDVMQRQRCSIVSQNAIFDVFSQSVSPFFDKEYVDFATSFPVAVLQGQAVCRAMFSRYFKKLASIVNVDDDRPLSHDRKAILNLIAYLGRAIPTNMAVSIYQRIRGKVYGKDITNMWDVMSFPQYETITSGVEQMIQKDYLWGNLLRKNAIKKILKEYQQSKGITHRVLARRLWGFFGFLEKFIDQNGAV